MRGRRESRAQLVPVSHSETATGKERYCAWRTEEEWLDLATRQLMVSRYVSTCTGFPVIQPSRHKDWAWRLPLKRCRIPHDCGLSENHLVILAFKNTAAVSSGIFQQQFNGSKTGRDSALPAAKERKPG